MEAERQEMTFAQIRQTEFDILKYFRDICQRERISYCLSNGSLLGAIKYRGFIPWDDDIDVFVPRKDYDHLMSSFEDTERYRLFSHERNPHYLFPFAKLCDMTTEKLEDNIDNGVRMGLNIDIFPLDIWPDDRAGAVELAAAINKDIYRLTFLKCRQALSAGRLKRLTKNIVLSLLRPTIPLVVRKITKSAKRNCKNEAPSYLGCVAWCIYGEAEIIPADVFSSMVPVSFEGETFMAPAGYEIYLRSLYGDYEKDPPADQQVTHHRFVAYQCNQFGG